MKPYLAGVMGAKRRRVELYHHCIVHRLFSYYALVMSNHGFDAEVDWEEFVAMKEKRGIIHSCCAFSTSLRHVLGGCLRTGHRQSIP